MIPYIVIYSFLFSLLFLEKIKGVKNIHKKYIMLFVVLVFVLFRGLRWEVGTDWEQFHDVFYKIEWGNFLELHRGGGGFLEPGYALLNLFVYNFIYENYTAFLIVMNLIILIIYYNCAWKYFPENPISIFICILLFDAFFPNRQGLAGAIVLFSYRYILTREFIKFAVTILIAASIHITTFLVLPFYFLLNRQYSIKLLLGIFFVSLYIAFSSFIPKMIESVAFIVANIVGVNSTLLLRAVSYTEFVTVEREKSFGAIALMFVRSFSLIWLFSIFRKKFKENILYNLSFNCFFVALFIGIIFKFQMEDVVRMQHYFAYGTFILFAIILRHLSYINSRFFLCFLFLYALYSQGINSNASFRIWPEAFIPYKTIFGG